MAIQNLGFCMGGDLTCVFTSYQFSPFIFIIQSLIGTDNAHLPFTAPGGNTEPIYASGYVCVLVGVIKCCK
jgi:hypothetical protein